MKSLSEPVGPVPIGGLHLQQDLVPIAPNRLPAKGHHQVRLALPRLLLHGVELAQERAEQLELVGIAHAAVGLLGLDLGEQHVDGVRLAGHLAQTGEPWRQLGILIGQAIDGLLQLDVPPDAELVEVVLGLGALEVVERRLGLAAIVQQVGEVDARLAVRGIELERAPKPVERPRVVAEPVRGVAKAGGRVRRIRMGRRRQVEEPVRRRDVPFPEQRPANLEHQLVIVLEAELEDPLEGPHRARPVAEL